MGKKRQQATATNSLEAKDEEQMPDIDPIKEIKASSATAEPSKRKRAAVDEDETADGQTQDVLPTEKKKRKKDKHEKADKKSKTNKPTDAIGEENPDTGKATPKKQGKEKSNSEGDSKVSAGDEATQSNDNDDDSGNAAGSEGKPSRFIVFVGNLPYTATESAVRSHFASVSPTDIRLLTERGNSARCRGVAFVEFGRYDHMKTCLQKMHHTDFDDGVSPVRKINVELT
jgi:nucleolar protein 6